MMSVSADKHRHLIAAALAIMVGAVPPSHAEVVESSAQHYVLRHQADSALTPEQLWQKLIKPSRWWHPDHTYSGDAANLTLDASAGGVWREDWDGNSVSHGTVLNLTRNELLRLNAPFGPLQEMAVTTIWTIKIAAKANGSVVTFDEVANGAPNSGLDELAKAVDFVKSEALQRLVN